MRGRDHQRAAELQKLALPAGERAGKGVGEAAQADQPEERLRLARGSPPRAARRAAAPERSASRSPGWSSAASIMFSSTVMRVSTRGVWKTRTSPAARDRVGAQPVGAARRRSGSRRGRAGGSPRSG